MDGGGLKKGIDGNVVGMLIFGMVGNDAGKGGSVTFGIVVGMVGRVGIVGSVGREVVGIGGSPPTLGSVGMAGSGGIETLGNVGIVGSVGTEVCSKRRAPKLTSMTESDKTATKDKLKQCLEVAIFSSEKELNAGL